MGILNPNQHEHPETRDRWEQRYGEPLKFDVSVNADVVKIGDEYFNISDLQKAHEENPQPASHPFKPHHYCLQKDLEELKRVRELHAKAGK